MPTVNLDGSIFTFPDSWKVEVYDTWKRSAKLAGSALSAKACDLVALSDDNVLYLIEAKDYTYPVGTRTPPLEKLAMAIARKGFHTLGGLYSGAHFDSDKAAFCRLALACRRIELYLSVELPADKGLLYQQSTTMATIQELLAREAKPFLSGKPFVVSSQNGNAPWSSARDPHYRQRGASH